MNTDQLIDRYWSAIVATTNKTQDMINDDAILLALNLAVTEAYDAGAALCNDMAAIIASQQIEILDRDKEIGSLIQVLPPQTPEMRQAEIDRAQLNMLNEWLANEAPALYRDPRTDTAQAIIAALRQRDDQIAELQGEIAKVDADNADLLRTLKAAHDGWTKAQADADRLALRIAQQPAEIHANGNGAPLAAPTPTDATWWANLDDETNDWRISLEAGRRTFRQVPKASRLLLAQAVARSIGGGALPMQHEFDAGKPDWMPGGGGLARSFGIVWSELLTVTTFEVAP